MANGISIGMERSVRDGCTGWVRLLAAYRVYSTLSIVAGTTKEREKEREGEREREGEKPRNVPADAIYRG